MKIFIYLLLVSLFTFSCGKKSGEKLTSNLKETILPKVDKTKPDRDKTDLEKENIAEKVKRVREEIFEAKKSSSGEVEKVKSIDVEITVYDEKGFKKPESGAKIKKDSNGRILEEEGYWEGRPASMVSYKYDTKGNLIQDTYYGYESGDGFLNNYKYNDKGWVTEVITDGEPSSPPRQYEYDKEGNKITEIYHGYESGKSKYKYDERGNIVEHEWISGDATLNNQGEVTTYKYEFDSKGNWISKIEYNGKNELQIITERTIEYYIDNTSMYANASKAFNEKNYVLVFESLKILNTEDEKYFEYVDLLFKTRDELMKCPDCKQEFASVCGKILDKFGKPIAGYLTLENLITKQIIAKCKINPNDGRYFCVIPLGILCGYYIEKEGYYPISKTFDLTSFNTDNAAASKVNRTEDMTLISLEEMAKENVAITINNIFFDFDKAVLKPESFPELDRLTEMLKSNSGMKVEISGHTDYVGTDEYNMTLSQSRAKAVKDYIVSKGISNNRINSIGYGKTVPVATNETEEGRKLNRRVEFKILK